MPNRADIELATTIRGYREIAETLRDLAARTRFAGRAARWLREAEDWEQRAEVLHDALTRPREGINA